MRHLWFSINGTDFGPIIKDLRIIHEITYEQIVITQDGREHLFGRRDRPIIEFSIHLLKSNVDAGIFHVLKMIPMNIGYNDPDIGVVEKQFRLDGNIEKELAVWNCVENGFYFDSGTIRIRSLEVI